MNSGRYDDCSPATCPNGKCNQTGECIEQVAREMRALGATLPCVESPPLVPPRPVGACYCDLSEPECIAAGHQGEARRQRLIDADSATRKSYPMARGLLDYFPDALAAVAQVSHIGNEKHNPGEPMHHARGKSMDHADCIMRHLVGRGGFDGDTRESAALAWRALALLQEELESEIGLPLPRGARAG